MKLTDEIEDVAELEKALGMETLEFFISQLVEEFEQIEVAKELRPWERRGDEKGGYIPPEKEVVRDERYVRPARFETRFLKEE